MKADINAEGILTLRSENEMEKFAIESWRIRNKVSLKCIQYDFNSKDHEQSWREFTTLVTKEAVAFKKFLESDSSPVEFGGDENNITIREKAKS